MPWETLALALADLVPSGTNIYSAPANQLVAPALVIRPDEPWITPRDEATFCFDHQHYVAVAVAVAATPSSAMGILYGIAQAVIQGLPEGWRFDTLGGLVLDDSTGTAFLAAPIRLSYFNTEEGS